MVHTKKKQQNWTLVTGGAGFLGSHLCEKLIEQGEDVVCMDNYHTGNENNVIHLTNNGFNRFRLINHDVRESFDQPPDLAGINITKIFNMASPASPPAYQDYPIYTSITNIHGMINVLKLARQHNARVIQASTSEVYGDPAVHPQVESYWGNVNPVGIRSCYDEAKRMAETLCADHMRQFGIDVRIARFFNTYGPNMDPNDGRVVSNFICQALRGEDLTIYGDGSQTRSFCYVDDTIEAFNKLGLVDLSHITDPQKRIVNIGNPGEFTIKELAELVLETMKEQRIETKSEIVYKDLPEDDPKQRQPNISYAKEILGWGGPKTELREGISETIPYFQEQLALAA